MPRKIKMLNIRKMRLSDAPAVAALEAATFPNPWRLADFEFEMTENPVACYLIAEEDGRLLGFAGAHLILDEGHVTNVAVTKEARGRGIGRKLMEGLMQLASNLGVSYMTLEVRASNVPAINLYQSLGFFKVSVRPRYYQDNQEDALLMVCDKLPPPQPDYVDEDTVFED